MTLTSNPLRLKSKSPLLFDICLVFSTEGDAVYEEVLDSVSDGINVDSNLLQAAGVPLEIVEEETKLLQAVKDGGKQ